MYERKNAKRRSVGVWSFPKKWINIDRNNGCRDVQRRNMLYRGCSVENGDGDAEYSWMRLRGSYLQLRSLDGRVHHYERINRVDSVELRIKVLIEMFCWNTRPPSLSTGCIQCQANCCFHESPSSDAAFIYVCDRDKKHFIRIYRHGRPDQLSDRLNHRSCLPGLGNCRPVFSLMQINPVLIIIIQIAFCSHAILSSFNWEQYIMHLLQHQSICL